MSARVDLRQLRAAYRASQQRSERQVTILERPAEELPTTDDLVALAASATRDTALADELRVRWAVRRWALRSARKARLQPRLPSLMPALAMAFSIAALAVVLWPRQQTSEPVFRGADSAGPALDTAVLERPPSQLSYAWPESAERVQLQLYDNALQPLWEGDWTTSQVQALPAALATSLQVGDTYYWRLRIDTGFELNWGELHRFRIQAEAADVEPVPK